MAPCTLVFVHRVMLIVDGRRWACQVIDLVYFHIERERNVMPDHFEVLMVEQVLDIATRTGEKVIDADDDRSIGKQAFAKMRSEETSTARHQYSLLKVHLVTPLPGGSRSQHGSAHCDLGYQSSVRRSNATEYCCLGRSLSGVRASLGKIRPTETRPSIVL